MDDDDPLGGVRDRDRSARGGHVDCPGRRCTPPPLPTVPGTVTSPEGTGATSTATVSAGGSRS